ncbi:hypothetical protein BKA62DRAFT_828479 [Auriculariales sp. MPI-PUGE-AT-0066]|nr:hypothetical protein BKA62DRAFT_828479 [Auriculariales sp. MPI-PUGE-AT-0066]
MINASSPSPQALTRLNALSQLGIVVPQVLAPGVATSLFAYSLQTKFLDGNLIWAALFLCACAFTAHAWFFIHEDENKIASGPQTST